MATLKNIGDNLIGSLKKAASEVEGIQVQLALGKAEAKDKFEELKKKFNGVVNTAKSKVVVGKKKLEEVHGEFDDLKVQLALGKADSVDAFNAQKKKIVKALNTLDKRLENVSLADEFDAKFHHSIEKFKIQIEVLRLHYELGKMEAVDEFEYEKQELNELVAKIKAKMDARKKATAKTRQARREELKEAYKHLKKAMVKA